MNQDQNHKLAQQTTTEGDAVKEVLDKAYTIAHKLGTNDLKEALRIIDARIKEEQEEQWTPYH